MFKVLLIVYVVGGGSKGSYDYTTSFNFQEFHSMEDCEMVRDEMVDIKDSWHFGSNKESIIPAHYSTKCVKMTATDSVTTITIDDFDTETEEVAIPPKPVQAHKKHSRWND